VHDIQNVTYFPLVGKTKEFDVSIIALPTAIRFGASVQPVVLVAEGKEPSKGEPLTIVGWGTNVRLTKNLLLLTLISTQY